MSESPLALRTNEVTFEGNIHFDKAVELLDGFKSSPGTDVLKQASDYLLESIKHDKRHAPSYYYLAYIFYTLDNTRFASKFVSLAEKLCPEPPIELVQFKNKVLNEGAMYKSFEFSQKKTISFEMPDRMPTKVNKPAEIKAVVSPESNLYKRNEPETVKRITTSPARVSASTSTVSSNDFKNLADKINATRPEPIKVKLSEKSSFWNIIKK